MALPPLPRPLDTDPHGKPTIGEWLVERCHDEQVAALADAETDNRISRLMDRGRKAVNGAAAPGSEGEPAPDDPPEVGEDPGDGP